MADTTGPRFKLIRRKRIQSDAADEEGFYLPVNHTQSPEKQIFQFLPSSDKANSDKAQPHAPRPVQNMNDYANPPDGLPIIIREKDLALRQQTMKHFLAINDFGSISEVMKKKQSHHAVIKHAPIEFVNNVASIASSKYVQKRNQGKMLVNELWGRKYHKSILYASGLRKAEFKIKGESLKVAPERIKSVGKYYERKHKDEIKKEREFLELLILPIENFKPNNELRDMLNTKDSTTFRRSSTVFRRNSLRRGSMMESQTQRGRIEPTEVDQPSPQNNQYKTSIFRRHQTFSPSAMSFNLKTGVSQQQNYDTGPLSDCREYTTVDTEPSIGGFRSPTEATLQNLSRCGSPRVGEGLFVSTKGFNLAKIKEEKEIEVNSPLLKTIQEGLFKSKAKETYENMNKEKAKHAAKHVAKQTSSRSESKHGRKITPLQGSEKLVKKKQNLQINVVSETDSASRLHTVSGEISLGTRPESSFDNNRLTPRDRPYRVHSISSRKTSSPFERGLNDQRKLSAGRTQTQNSQRTEDPRPSTSVSSAYGITRLHTATSAGIRKTDEIERLKKNFLNLMFYCEEVRNDQEIKNSMKETQSIARELFASRREKYLRSAKYQEKLQKTILNFFTKTKFCSDKDILEGESNSASSKKKFSE